MSSQPPQLGGSGEEFYRVKTKAQKRNEARWGLVSLIALAAFLVTSLGVADRLLPPALPLYSESIGRGLALAGAGLTAAVFVMVVARVTGFVKPIKRD